MNILVTGGCGFIGTNYILKQFREMQKVMKQMRGIKGVRRMPGLLPR